MPALIAFWLTIVIFSLTYLGLALGKFPGLRTDRTGIALVGASAILACGLLSFDDAMSSIDFPTIVLLLGMMIVVVFLRRAGFFDVLTSLALRRVQRPAALLAVVMVLSGVLSALLVNDVVCLALTPLVLGLARQLHLDPKPHLIGLAVASNVGSTATLTGNPQNMIIGGLSHISYLRFVAKLAPLTILCLVVAYFVTLFVYRNTFRAAVAKAKSSDPSDSSEKSAGPMPSGQRALLIKSLMVAGGAVLLFFTGAPMPIVAIGAASILLLDRIRPEGIYRQLDWSLLLMFAGLFVVVHGFEVHVLSRFGVAEWNALREHPIGLLSGVSAVLSNVVSNVPAVLLFKTVIPAMSPDLQETAWFALAMSSTLAGNLTVLGSVANLIVVEYARKENVTITLADYCWVGVPVTVLTLILGIGWLALLP